MRTCTCLMPVFSSLPFVKIVCHLVLQLSDEEEYSDILEDVREEAENFGNIVQVQPAKQAENPSDPNSTIPMFLEFSDTESAAKCYNALRGRKFDGRVVEAKYVNVDDTPFGNQENQPEKTEDSTTAETNVGSASESATVSTSAIEETGNSADID